MAFSSLSIEQLTFDADDKRCQNQSLDSFESLVNYDSEFPQRESLVFKIFDKRKGKRQKQQQPPIDSSSSNDDEDCLVEEKLSNENKVNQSESFLSLFFYSKHKKDNAN